MALTIVQPGVGGTGLSSATPSNGQIPIGNGTGYTSATITAGTGITVTNGAGSISIASTATSAVIQVKNATTTSKGFQAAGTATDFPGLTVSITPTSASNKVLVIVNAWFCGDTPTANYYLKLQRNGTNIGQGGGNDTAGYVGNSAHRQLSDGQDTSNIQNGNFSFLDSPASTSALTYKIQTQGNGGQFYYNQSAANSYFFMQSSITVMEVTP
jgi:hypothetical protein